VDVISSCFSLGDSVFCVDIFYLISVFCRGTGKDDFQITDGTGMFLLFLFPTKKKQ